MNLRQIQDTPNTRVIQFNEDCSLHITFDCASDIIAPVGTPVKLGSDGKAVVAASTDAAIGLVYIGKNLAHNGQPRIGISTNFKAEIKGIASGSITCGTEVTTDGATETAVKYKTAATGDKVIGIALQTVASGSDVRIGSFIHFYKK